jgi:hypothetical protein
VNYISGSGAGVSRRRRVFLKGLVASIGLAGCDGSPAEPQNPTPELSNFTYTVLEVNIPECPPHGLANGTQFRWTIEFSDLDGDVVAPVLMEWSSLFNPSGRGKQALLLVPAGAVTQTGPQSGTISQSQCIRFGEQESVDVTLSLYDEMGHHSNPRTLRIERPAGAM